jgi:hypothetical protein
LIREASVVANLMCGEVHTQPYVFSSSSWDLSSLFYTQTDGCISEATSLE